MTEQPKYGIVLLPPAEVWDWLQQLNLIVNGGMEHPPILLDEHHKPHVSLAHMYVTDVQALIEPLTQVIDQAHPVTVLLSAFSVDTIGGHTWSSVVIQDTSELHQLHIAIMDVVQPFETQPSSYRTTFSYDRFWPHFTIGVDVMPADMDFAPRQVTIDRVALCRMDPPYSTCGEIIHEWKLT